MANFVFDSDYQHSENRARALDAAYSTIWALRHKEIDWSLRLEEIERALEVLCDASGGSPSFAYNTIMLMQPDLRQPGVWESEDEVSRAVRRATDLTIMAEVAHRVERYGQAIIWCEVALGGLVRAASQRGDQASFLKLLASARRREISCAATAVVGIWMASVRRTSWPPQVKADHFDRLDPMISALIASGRTYSRSHSFGSQGHFLEAERLLSEQEPTEQRLSRLNDLHEISEKTRGISKRALATAPLVEMEYLRARGDLPGAEKQAAIACERLIDFGLPRHLERMAKYRYLTFDAS